MADVYCFLESSKTVYWRATCILRPVTETDIGLVERLAQGTLSYSSLMDALMTLNGSP